MKTVWLMSWKVNPLTQEVEPYLSREVVNKITHFPLGSSFYSGPHWHVIYAGGFRTNWPEKYHKVVSIA
jgi:hypothetical protein